MRWGGELTGVQISEIWGPTHRAPDEFSSDQRWSYSPITTVVVQGARSGANIRSALLLEFGMIISFFGIVSEMSHMM